MSETTTMSANLQSSGNFGIVTQHVVNDVVVTKMQIENTYCEICNITCNSGDVFKKHQQGKKHSKNMQKLAILSAITTNMPPPVANATSVRHLENKKHTLLQNGASANSLIFCEICNVVCNNQDVFTKHIGGKKHAAKVTGRRDCVSNPSVHPSNDGTQKQPENIQSVWCEICKITCNSFEIFSMHISGKKHLKNLKKSEEGQSSAPMTTTTKSNEDKTVNSTEGTAVWCELCGIGCNTYDVLKTHITGKKHQKNLEKSQKFIGPNTALMAEAEMTTPVIGPMQIAVKEEGKVVDAKKGKRKASLEDLETKRQKAVEGGAESGALRTCTVCNVVCTSPTVFITHLAGKKHAAMAVKQAEAGSNGQNS